MYFSSKTIKINLINLYKYYFIDYKFYIERKSIYSLAIIYKYKFY